jgi:hypothetical protein
MKEEKVTNAPRKGKSTPPPKAKALIQPKVLEKNNNVGDNEGEEDN